MEPYATPIEHLTAELSRIDLLLQRELALARQSATGAPDDFRGLVITEGEIDALARQPEYLGQRWRYDPSVRAVLEQFDHRAATLRTEIDDRCRLSREAGVWLPLVELAIRAGLSSSEVDLLLITLAPELEPRYETLYAYIQDDVTRKHPSVDLALNVVSRSTADKLAARRYLHDGSPLLAFGLLALEEEPFDRHPPMPRMFLKTHEDVVAALIGQWSVNDARTETIVPAPAEPSLDVDAVTGSQLDALVQQLGLRPRVTTLVSLAGDVSAAKHAAEWIAFRLRRPVLLASRESLEREPERRARFLRTARLGGSIVAVTALPVHPEPAGAERRVQVDNPLPPDLLAFDDIVLLIGDGAAFPTPPPGIAHWHVEIPAPDFRQRRAHWAEALGSSVDPLQLSRLADAFRFGRTSVSQTVDLAGRLAALRRPAAEASIVDFVDAGRMLTTPRLQRFARKVRPQAEWKDLVLAPDKLEQLRRIARWKRLRHHVYEDWGFSRRLTRGKGQCILFTGASGTGKTLAAEVLAADLQLDLFQIDLSTVVSRYVGDMEASLSAIFREAEDSQCLLFFDEADALFGKRTEVKDAHDRYANIEVDFLLQRLEQFDGIVILATNMRRNMDEAFVRRLNDVLEFASPDEAARERIWRGHFPRRDLCHADVDIPILARQFKLTGGSIRNIVLDAAFRAAADNRRIEMLDILLSVKADLAKQGRLPTKSEFGAFYDLVQLQAPPALLVGQ